MRRYPPAHAALTPYSDLAANGTKGCCEAIAEIAMNESIQLHWIEQADAKSVREYAGLCRAASEPGVGIEFTRVHPNRVGRRRKLDRIINRTIATARSF